MANNAPCLCLVCYDIAEPKRLGRVHRYLVRLAIPIQYSVFTVQLSPKKQRRLLRDLSSLINPKEDDVRLYPLSERLERVMMGKQFFPDGVILLDGAMDLLSMDNFTLSDSLQSHD